VSSDDSQRDGFSYVLTERELPAQNGVLLLVSLSGPIQRTSLPHFERLIEEVGTRKVDWVVLSFRDVPRQIERPMYASLAKMQKIVRDKPAELKVCDLHSEVRTALEHAGILRPQEIAGKLEHALKALTPKKRS
jgi:anti-anti-sigma regulatory factor